MVESIGIDGRNARGLRTRGEIIAALLDLVREGDISPTMQAIADRAGVSVRSIYQHFTDTEGLYREVGEEIDHLGHRTSRRSGPFGSAGRPDRGLRLRPLPEPRVTDQHLPCRLSHRAQLAGLAEDSCHHQWVGSGSVGSSRSHPELAKLNKQSANVVLDTLDVWCSLGAWDHLRAGGHSVASARKVMVRGLHLLLAGSRL